MSLVVICQFSLFVCCHLSSNSLVNLTICQTNPNLTSQLLFITNVRKQLLYTRIKRWKTPALVVPDGIAADITYQMAKLDNAAHVLEASEETTTLFCVNPAQTPQVSMTGSI